MRWYDIDLSPTTWMYNQSHEQASKKFPVLLEYEGNWVVHDYLCTYLKNSAQKAKKDQQQMDKEPEAAAKGKGRGVYTPGSSVALILLWTQVAN